MRTLEFIVDGQILKSDPNCDFSNLVAGTRGYLRARFHFSPEWKNCIKVASFYSPTGDEYPPQILHDGATCMIPDEACAKRRFKVGIIGKRGDSRLITNTISVVQNGGSK